MIKISKNRYDLYVFFTRNVLAEFFVEELEWYMNEAQSLWAVIGLDRQDRDYTVIISARDKNRQIRCMDTETGFVTIEAARAYLPDKMRELEKSVIRESDFNRSNTEAIFRPLPKKHWNDAYLALAQSPVFSCARNVIRELMPHFFDVDNNFVEQFQTGGFDARLWELYLFCYFKEEGLNIDRSHPAPDFLLSDGNLAVSVEAVIAADRGLKTAGKIPEPEELPEKEKLMAARWGSPLYSKLSHTDKTGKHYWEHEHTQNKPFVIAIADFHEPFSMIWSQNSLTTYLYGRRYSCSYDREGNLQIRFHKVEQHERANNPKPIPSGFFFQAQAEHISAVLHSSCATISKFNRIGKQCGLDESESFMLREGRFYNPAPNASKPLRFAYVVSEENSETWAEGVTVFHNPNAKFPLPEDFFPNAAHCYLKGDFLVTAAENAIVYSSMTYHFIKGNGSFLDEPLP
ncbi:MAG: hypothetical protein NC081_12010 [Roseburia sp.]|nr:hypothetical protein [Roseburia sp.]